MKVETVSTMRSVAGWAFIVAGVVTVFLPPRSIQFGAAATWLLAGVWLFFYSLHGYIIKEFGVIDIADDYLGRQAEIAATIVMVFAVIVFVLPALGWLVLQFVRLMNQ